MSRCNNCHWQRGTCFGCLGSRTDICPVMFCPFVVFVVYFLFHGCVCMLLHGGGGGWWCINAGRRSTFEGFEQEQEATLGGWMDLEDGCCCCYISNYPSASLGGRKCSGTVRFLNSSTQTLSCCAWYFYGIISHRAIDFNLNFKCTSCCSIL